MKTRIMICTLVIMIIGILKGLVGPCEYRHMASTAALQCTSERGNTMSAG